MKVRVVQGHTRLVGLVTEERGEPVLGVSPLLGERAIAELREAMARVQVTAKVAITMGMGGMLTMAEVAELIHVSPRTIRRWKDEGRIDYTRVGRAVRFTPEQYLRLAQEGPREPQTGREGESCPGVPDGLPGPPVEPPRADTPVAA